MCKSLLEGNPSFILPRDGREMDECKKAKNVRHDWQKKENLLFLPCLVKSANNFSCLVGKKLKYASENRCGETE